ncbi:MAG: type II toxin-antitoxin system VapC family toxin [Pseudonocardia sp.]|nr:type II toxin-antitoxin system VapC family toxin [Pseudonocardia sp.]
MLVALPTLHSEHGLPDEPVISTITLAELSVGPLVAKTEGERVERQRVLQQAESDFDALTFDAAAARAFGGVSAGLRAVGRKPEARAYDALIAAVALANDLPVHTCNPDDFAHINGLRVVPVPLPEIPT